MREIVTAVEMKELDHNTIQKAGISSPVLMERAAASVERSQNLVLYCG